MPHFGRAYGGGGPWPGLSLAGLVARVCLRSSPRWARLRRDEGVCARLAERASQPVGDERQCDHPEWDESCPKNREEHVHILTKRVGAVDRERCSGRPNSELAAARWRAIPPRPPRSRSEEHTSELQSQSNLVCRLLLE